MTKESGFVLNFRLNFRDALKCDGRSLSGFSRDIKTSVSYLSRIRSGTKHTDNGQPIVPGLDTCDRIATGLGYSLLDMLLAPTEFRKLLRTKYPDFKPDIAPEPRGRPAPRTPRKIGPRKRTPKKTPAA
jgi:hypothetical protein